VTERKKQRKSRFQAAKFKEQKDRGQKMPPVLSISLRFSYFLLRLPVDIS